MITARASGSKLYLYFMKKGRQARHRIPRNSCPGLLFSYLEEEVFLKWGRVCYEMTLIHIGGNNENDRFASPESIYIHLKICF